MTPVMLLVYHMKLGGQQRIQHDAEEGSVGHRLARRRDACVHARTDAYGCMASLIAHQMTSRYMGS